jgi:hypothetical protein
MTRIDDDAHQYPSDWDRDNLIPKKQELPMTERTIKKDELRNSLANLGITFKGINEIIEAAFPPIFKPKEGEVIWASLFGGDSYRLRVFRQMDNGEYVCVDGSKEGKCCHYSCAKPQTPRNKGE